MMNQFDMVNSDGQGKPHGKCPYQNGSCVQDAEKCHKWQPMPMPKPTTVATATPQIEIVYLCQDDIMRIRVEQMIAMLGALMGGARRPPSQMPPHLMGPHG